MEKEKLIQAAELGALTGVRSLAVPALKHPHYRFLAALEMIGDKVSFAPPRTNPIAIAGRAIVGAFVGAAVAPQEKNEKDEKHNFRQTHRSSCYSAEAEYRCNQRDDQQCDSKAEHDPFSKLEYGVNSWRLAVFRTARAPTSGRTR